MKYIEYGKENHDGILLLHGGGLSWWNYREAAEILCENYHVILPILDGHAGSDKNFTSIENNAADIIAFLDEHQNGHVLLIGGLSLGGQIALEILSQRKDICTLALIESALVLPSRITAALIPPVFGSCYGLIRQKWFANLQFRYLRMKQNLFEDYFRDTCGITKPNMIAFLQANSLYSLKDSIKDSSADIHIAVGGKENHAMRTSAAILHEKIPGSQIQTLPKMYHGEFSINHAADYAKKITEMIQRRKLSGY